MAPEHIRLENCAAWHIEAAERAAKSGIHELAGRHDMIALRLFRQAHELRSMLPISEAA